MNTIFDHILSVVAPEQCIGCGVEGHVLCPSCLVTAGEPPTQRCAGCSKLSAGSKTCQACKKWLCLDAVHVATKYEGFYERLLHEYKFECRRKAVVPVAKILHDLQIDTSDLLLCHVPTAHARIRQRGFDHMKLLAKTYASINDSNLQHLLRRRSNTRQLGADKKTRIKQMEHEFSVAGGASLEGKSILLLDDMMTTGASLSSAGRILRRSGAKHVSAIVFAQKV